ncbi:MAG: hypothetical protein ABIH77_02065 [Pseudomonadota bacterium]|nr:hypothetical protein [Gammaproteobacteria bacterium]MBU1629299.1 hypothetical protein [Gammaproteobacteria bacterium]MBU2546634.1 hypothetical protein [Gammaproteobacteria bacterium]
MFWKEGKKEDLKRPLTKSALRNLFADVKSYIEKHGNIKFSDPELSNIFKKHSFERIEEQNSIKIKRINYGTMPFTEEEIDLTEVVNIYMQNRRSLYLKIK